MKAFGNFIGGVIALPIYALGVVGWLYWIWQAIQIGSFWMFVVGFLPFVSVPVGAYSFIFGVPAWVYRIFG